MVASEMNRRLKSSFLNKSWTVEPPLCSNEPPSHPPIHLLRPGRLLNFGKFMDPPFIYFYILIISIFFIYINKIYILYLSIFDIVFRLEHTFWFSKHMFLNAIPCVLRSKPWSLSKGYVLGHAKHMFLKAMPCVLWSKPWSL